MPPKRAFQRSGPLADARLASKVASVSTVPSGAMSPSATGPRIGALDPFETTHAVSIDVGYSFRASLGMLGAATVVGDDDLRPTRFNVFGFTDHPVRFHPRELDDPPWPWSGLRDEGMLVLGTADYVLPRLQKELEGAIIISHQAGTDRGVAPTPSEGVGIPGRLRRFCPLVLHLARREATSSGLVLVYPTPFNGAAEYPVGSPGKDHAPRRSRPLGACPRSQWRQLRQPSGPDSSPNATENALTLDEFKPFIDCEKGAWPPRRH
jgi:hypothetical protein